MKKYVSPFIEDECVEIEDVIALSGVTEQNDGSFESPSEDESGSMDQMW